jgi:hypothetical protein
MQVMWYQPVLWLVAVGLVSGSCKQNRHSAVVRLQQ